MNKLIWTSNKKNPLMNIYTVYTMYDSRPYVFYRNGESFQPEVSDQS